MRTSPIDTCVTCGARPGECCITRGGSFLFTPHPEREAYGWEAKYDEQYRVTPCGGRFDLQRRQAA